MNFTANECEIGKADRDPGERIETSRINKNKHGALRKDVNEDEQFKHYSFRKIGPSIFYVGI